MPDQPDDTYTRYEARRKARRHRRDVGRGQIHQREDEEQERCDKVREQEAEKKRGG